MLNTIIIIVINKNDKMLVSINPGRQIQLSDPVGSYPKNYRVIGSDRILLEFLGSYRILLGSFALSSFCSYIHILK
jgi:hypothetical protein